MKKIDAVYNRLLLLSLIFIILILFSVRIAINHYYDQQALELSVMDTRSDKDAKMSTDDADHQQETNKDMSDSNQNKANTISKVDNESIENQKTENQSSENQTKENQNIGEFDSPETLTLDKLNTLTKEEWMTIKGIGDKTSDLILAYKADHGDFKTFEELLNIKGIGEKKLQAIKESKW